ncbi:MAG: DUF2786 domain-containing protein [Sphaerochaeta sp.]|nr:DUF2786 domain-containing protein [Sphaerochaeta sp.]
MGSSKKAIIDRINKVRNLANRGIGGEQDNAQTIVEELMAKYQITEAELNYELSQEFRWFRFSTRFPLSKRLLAQVIFSVVGGRSVYKEGKSTKLGVDCTIAEAIEIEAKYHFYKTIIKEEMDVFFLAFANKHNLFPPEELRPATGRDSGISRSKLLAMMEALDTHSFRKQIGEF